MESRGDAVRERVAEGGEGGEIVAVTGRATIQVAAELKKRLLQAVASGTGVTIDVSGITGADASFFQLICSTHRTLLAAGRTLRLSRCRSGEFLKAADLNGFSDADSNCRHGGCLREGECP